MKFSELWLREWVNISLDSEALLDQINMAGLKVEGIEPVAAMFQDVVVGEVVRCGQHPKVDNLLVTKVNVGGKRLLNIVCGAQNCRKGVKVAVAKVGSVLPGNFKIKEMDLRGRLSEGMLCSYSELGIINDHSGIIELPEDAPIGIDVRNYLKLDDNIIEISITPNRTDCLSIIGVARDVAALNKTELNMPDISPVAATIRDILPIQVERAYGFRYLGRVVKGINVKAMTPLWIKEKLRRCGIRSINAVLDVSNYVLLELGQPIRIFDKSCIDNGIILRMAKEGENLTLLDGRRVRLNADTLVIADHGKALAIGGMFDIERSVVKEETQNVLLECVFLNTPLSIRGWAHHGLHCRYERGIDPALQHKAMERATRLLIDICGGEAGPVIDVTDEATPPKHTAITLRRSKLDRLIGYHINDAHVNEILYRLGCNVIEGENWWQVVPPSWRFDMKIEEDLVEEVARIYGYNNIPKEPVRANLIMGNHREADLSIKRVKTLLNDKGYQEVITYSFVDPKTQQLIHPGEEALMLLSPISSEMCVMRLSLWTGLLGTIVYNQNRQQSCVRIFETGFRFVPDVRSNLGVRQDMMLAGAISGNPYEDHWNLAKSSFVFYDLKGDLESVLDLTGKLSEIKFCAEAIPALHPGQSAAIYMKGERIGFIGVMHPELERKLGLNDRTIVFELEWDKLADRIVPQAQNVSRFPMNRRDIAIIVNKNVPAADILSECNKIGLNQVVGVHLFDVYHGKGVAEGFKSLAIRLIFQDHFRTLEEKEIAATVAKCVEVLKERFQASLRD